MKITRKATIVLYWIVVGWNGDRRCIRVCDNDDEIKKAKYEFGHKFPFCDVIDVFPITPQNTIVGYGVEGTEEAAEKIATFLQDESIFIKAMMDAFVKSLDPRIKALEEKINGR